MIYEMVEKKLLTGSVGPFDTVHAHYIPKILVRVDGTWLNYFWTFCFKTGGASKVNYNFNDS